jgi:hypothetical protein
MRKINIALAGAAIAAAAMLAGCGKSGGDTTANAAAPNSETHDSTMAPPDEGNATVGAAVNADASTNTAQ